MDRGAWWAAVHGVRESDMTTHEHEWTLISVILFEEQQKSKSYEFSSKGKFFFFLIFVPMR